MVCGEAHVPLHTFFFAVFQSLQDSSERIAQHSIQPRWV
jgi:hypothetical protein